MHSWHTRAQRTCASGCGRGSWSAPATCGQGWKGCPAAWSLQQNVLPASALGAQKQPSQFGMAAGAPAAGAVPFPRRRAGRGARWRPRPRAALRQQRGIGKCKSLNVAVPKRHVGGQTAGGGAGGGEGSGGAAARSQRRRQASRLYRAAALYAVQELAAFCGGQAVEQAEPGRGSAPWAPPRPWLQRCLQDGTCHVACKCL